VKPDLRRDARDGRRTSASHVGLDATSVPPDAGRRWQAVLVVSLLGPGASAILAFCYGLAVDLALGAGLAMKELPTLLGVGATVTLVGAVVVLPVAAGAAMVVTLSGSRSRLVAIGLGIVLGPGTVTALVGLMAWAEGSLDDPTVLPTAEDLGFLLMPALAGALCGEVYWRMAVRPQPPVDRSSEPPW
jgi:hypothetical protein